MNLEVLLANKAKRAAFQAKLVAREREKKADDAKAAQRARWERGDFSDPVVEKRTEREEKARRREARARRKEADTPVPAAEEPGALVVSGSVGDGTAVATAEATASLREDAVVASLAESGTSDTATRLSVAGNQVPHFFVFGDLRPGMTYRLRVAVVSAIGQGKWSATTVSTTTLATPPAQPQPPAVDPRHVELFSLRVGWTSPDEHGSAPQPSRSCIHHSLWVTVAFKTVSSVRDPTGLLRRRRFFMGPAKFLSERPLSFTRCPQYAS